MTDLNALLSEVRRCNLCAASLPLGPRPILQCSASAKILIAGQAPGSKVHASGVPFDDPSGDRLRDWPSMLPLPHPSPRNNRWFKQNPWFAIELLPELKTRVNHILQEQPNE